METLRGLHLLLVEDDRDSREVLKLAMELDGATVFAAGDGDMALEVLRNVTPDVLVTDISMPRRDGVSLVHEARERGLLQGVPTLAITGVGMGGRHVLQAGFDAYLRKPVDPGDLSASVQTLARLRRSRQRRAA